MKDRDAYVKEIKAKIDEWNKEIDKLAVQAAKAKKTADEQLALLKKNSKNYQKKYDELRKASGKAWDDIRDGLEEAGEAVKDAFKKAKKHFG